MSSGEPSVPKRTDPPSAKPKEAEEREKTLTGRVAEVLAKICVDPLFFLFGVLLLFIGIHVWVFLPPMPQTKVMTHPTGLSCAVKYPRWIAVGDVEEFTITLINNGSRPLTDVNAFLVFTDTLHVSTDVNSGNKADFGELAVDECKTRSMGFLLDRSKARSPLKAELRVASKELREKTLDTFTFGVIYDRLPIPYCKSILRKLVAFVLLIMSSTSAFIGKEALKTLQIEKRAGQA